MQQNSQFQLGLYCVSCLPLCTEIVRATFVHEDSSRVRGYIRQKLNNADKVMKRKMAMKESKESVQCTENVDCEDANDNGSS
jgi:hypothetical protein